MSGDKEMLYVTYAKKVPLTAHRSLACATANTKAAEVKRHMLAVVKKEKIYICGRCGKELQ